MALRGLQVYQAAVARGSGDVRPDLPVDLLSDGDVHEAHSTTQSQALNDPAEPSIIISASGMASGGRVLHHLKAMLPTPGTASCSSAIGRWAPAAGIWWTARPR